MRLAGMYFGFCLILAGCQSMPTGQLMSGVNKQGLPDHKYLVGTAVDQVDYRAPVAGTAYLVEGARGRVIAIKSLKEGENWLYKFPKMPETEIERTYGPGQPNYQLRVSLYFIPASSMRYQRGLTRAGSGS